MSVFLESEVFALDIFEQGKVFGAVVEVIVAQHAVVNEEFQVVPFLLIDLEDVSYTNLTLPTI